jgi:uncharacterized membrane protein (DUF2068 family)
MHTSTLITLGFTSLALAREYVPTRFETRAVANLPAVKATIEVVARDAAALDSAIVALTEANANSQLDIINKNLLTMAADLSQQAKKINASGAVGVMEAAGLLSTKTQQEWMALVTKLNTTAFSTYDHIMAKKDIVKTTGKIDKITPGIKAQKQGILDIISTVPGQIPAAIKNQLSSMLAKAATATPAAGASPRPKMPGMDDLMGPGMLTSAGKLIDDLLDQIINILSGKADAFTVPAAIAGALPAGALPTGAAGGIAPPAAPKATAAPKASAAPSASAAPKASAVPKASAAPKAAAAPKSTAKGSAKGPVAQFDEFES